MTVYSIQYIQYSIMEEDIQHYSQLSFMFHVTGLYLLRILFLWKLLLETAEFCPPGLDRCPEETLTLGEATLV